VAAWNSHAAANLDKVIVARWGGWTMRHSQRHRAKGADQ
jgi:hypothetical protein